MELGKAIQIIGVAFCVLLVVTEIYSLPPYSSEDYEQGKLTVNFAINLDLPGFVGCNLWSKILVESSFSCPISLYSIY